MWSKYIKIYIILISGESVRTADDTPNLVSELQQKRNLLVHDLVILPLLLQLQAGTS